MFQKTKIRVGIVEKKRMFRERLADIIGSQTDMVVVFLTSVPDARSNPADVILLQWEISYSPLFRKQNEGTTKPKILVFNADLQRKRAFMPTFL